MKSNPQGNWCIFYNKVEENIYHTMKLQRSDGILVSAKTYDDVFKFTRYKDAWKLAKELITAEPLRYNATVRRVCRARNDAFYLSGN
jgi:hypothetical protein